MGVCYLGVFVKWVFVKWVFVKWGSTVDETVDKIGVGFILTFTFLWPARVVLRW